jgi:hypothetical protein
MNRKHGTLPFAVLLLTGGLGLLVRPTAGSVIPCAGDCNNHDRVTVSELISGVNIALDRQEITKCPVFDLE